MLASYELFSNQRCCTLGAQTLTCSHLTVASHTCWKQPKGEQHVYLWYCVSRFLTDCVALSLLPGNSCSFDSSQCTASTRIFDEPNQPVTIWAQRNENSKKKNKKVGKDSTNFTSWCSRKCCETSGLCLLTNIEKCQDCEQLGKAEHAWKSQNSLWLTSLTSAFLTLQVGMTVPLEPSLPSLEMPLMALLTVDAPSRVWANCLWKILW